MLTPIGSFGCASAIVWCLMHARKTLEDGWRALKQRWPLKSSENRKVYFHHGARPVLHADTLA